MPEAPVLPPSAAPARFERDHARIRRLRLVDGIVRRAITGGGLLIVLAVLGIFVFVFAEAVPLLYPAVAVERPAEGARSAPGRALAVGEDEYREAGWALSATGRIRLVDFVRETVAGEEALGDLGGATLLGGGRALDQDVAAAGTSDGRVLVAGILFEPIFGDGRRQGQTVRVGWQAEFTLREKAPVSLVAVASDGERVTVAGAGEGFLAVASRRIEGMKVEVRDLSSALAGHEPVSLALAHDAGSLCVGTAAGRVLRLSLDGEGPAPREILVAGSSPVTAVAYAFGSQTILVGDAAGRVSGWQGIRSAASGGAPAFTRVREFETAPAAVTAFAPSRRNKTFLVVDRRGGVRLDLVTTARTLADVPARGEGGPAAVAPKQDGAVVVVGEGALRRLDFDSPHPEVTFGTLFTPILYEGYDRPEFVWQSTGGTDDYEPKLSLVPLVAGSLKGVLYAMLFSVPLALLAAVYTSQFAPPGMRSVVKPTVEIMAALPSVVVGFLAGLWLSPFLERHLAHVSLLVLGIPVAVLAAVAALRLLPAGLQRWFAGGREILLLGPFLAAAVAGAMLAGGGVEDAVFGGSLRAWLLAEWGVRYDPRNAVVVGFALGFAVIPVIYTVSEDAMSNVPRSLRAASEALGASRWQTAWRLVVPAASPGIFAALMLGFGRAIGETMIVVMATGNTPILDFSPFCGMRTISACIAVEMPEAPMGGTLYRVLFLAGAVLFAFAFLCNTFADLVGQRLRDRYAKW